MKRSNFYSGREAQARSNGELWALNPVERDICANRHKGAKTSVEAHKRIRGSLSARREAVYKEIKFEGEHGLTVDELADLWSQTPNAISGRFTELAGKFPYDKFPKRIEKRGTRPTRSGCPAAVWFAIPNERATTEALKGKS